MNLSKTAVIVSALISGLILTSTTLAINLPVKSTAKSEISNLSTKTERDSEASAPNRVDNSSSSANRKLQNKLQACQAREKAIKQRSTGLIRLVSTMETHFDAIVQRVEQYYTSKIIPSGKTVSNYDTLTTNIQTKKAAVQTALDKASADATSFSCISTDPKTQIQSFTKDMQAVKKALKEYRTSIKNLIVAIHSVVGEGKIATSSAQKTGSKD